jgi:HJR/Mrr/RecB family endonuclease
MAVSEPEGFFERSFLTFVSRISGLTVIALALFLYVGCGLVLPLTLRWSTLNLVEANALGTVFAAVVCLGWLGVRIQLADRRNLLQWTTDLRHLDSTEFEWLVGEMFRREGWEVRETGSSDGPDGNIDLELTHDHERQIVQCKRWTSKSVGVEEVRLLLGTLAREHLPPESGILVTLSKFTMQAEKEALDAGLPLLDGKELHARIEKARHPEPCPKCHSPMILDYSVYGWWLRCVTGGCEGKIDLSNDVGRAAEFLLRPR